MADLVLLLDRAVASLADAVGVDTTVPRGGPDGFLGGAGLIVVVIEFPLLLLVVVVDGRGPGVWVTAGCTLLRGVGLEGFIEKSYSVSLTLNWLIHW